MRLSIIALLAFSSAFVGCNKASSAKTYACQRNVTIECELNKSSDCREAQGFLAAEKNREENPLGADTAASSCRNFLARMDQYANSQGFKTIEQMIEAKRKPASGQ